MAAKRVGNSNRGRKAVPILKSAIEEAQRHTNSNRQAAIWLGVAYPTYKRYAKIYGIFDRHANPLGLGTTKGFGKRPSTISLRDIFANKHPEYSMIRLKYRMVARHMLDEKCGVCGFNERRITDNKTPLMLTFKNQIGDFTRDNLHLLCYNCMFLTTGAPWVAHQKQIVNSWIYASQLAYYPGYLYKEVKERKNAAHHYAALKFLIFKQIVVSVLHSIRSVEP